MTVISLSICGMLHQSKTLCRNQKNHIKQWREEKNHQKILTPFILSTFLQCGIHSAANYSMPTLTQKPHKKTWTQITECMTCGCISLNLCCTHAHIYPLTLIGIVIMETMEKTLSRQKEFCPAVITACVVRYFISTYLLRIFIALFIQGKSLIIIVYERSFAFC